MRDPYDRRTLLKVIGAGSITTALAGCSSDGGDGDGDGGDGSDGDGSDGDGSDGEPNHEVPHPGGDSVPDAEATAESLSGGEREPGAQSAKDNASVMLQHKASGGQHCGNCSLFVPDQDDDGFGACTSVAGKIHPCDWCLLYTEYSGDDSVPCEQ